MIKRLVVFFDGTWNRADQHDKGGMPCPTNIVKLFEATLPCDAQGNPQIVHYIQGVGTRKLERMRGGGFGLGISGNIKEGYKFLVNNYEPGDGIYIFGFSRGAYSARSLAGMIHNIGILKRVNMRLVNRGYDIYKDRSKKWHPKSDGSKGFRRDYTWGDERVKFLGVFDTVGALGAPFGILLGWVLDKIFKCHFHDTHLSSIIQSAYHAVAVDERRLPFRPTFMTPNKMHNPASFEEKWFPGVHSDIGGGYAETGLSDIALEWMVSKAVQHDLNLDISKSDKPPCAPNLLVAPHDSQTILYRILSVLLVKLPSVIGVVSKKYAGAIGHLRWTGNYLRPIPNKGSLKPFLGQPPVQPLSRYQGCLHPSVIEKINLCAGQYDPPNV